MLDRLDHTLNEAKTHIVDAKSASFNFLGFTFQMSRIRNHAEERLRTNLRKRHKIRNLKTGYKTYPTQDLYERYGLYKTPMKAGWNAAHALV